MSSKAARAKSPSATTLGLVGSMVGASLVVVGVSASRSWTPALGPWAPCLAPRPGGASGLLAGPYPSLRAAFLEPVEALRSTM